MCMCMCMCMSIDMSMGMGMGNGHGHGHGHRHRHGHDHDKCLGGGEEVVHLLDALRVTVKGFHEALDRFVGPRQLVQVGVEPLPQDICICYRYHHLAIHTCASGYIYAYNT
jgi:hypothetical protein